MEELHTGDIRLERMELEYKTLRHMQNQFMDRMDKFNAAFQQLSDEVRANREAIEANRKAIEANREAIEANREAIEANREAIEANRKAIEELTMMVAAIIKHLDVPYKPMGFVTD